jgi:dipeptidyl aminopeptidase/acylaminoacyl peptidase
VSESLTPFADLAQFVALPRVTSLALSPDGNRLVAAIHVPDERGAKYISALWELDPDGQQAPARLTHSEKGESAPAFLPDGSLLFTSGRPDPDAPDEESAALWRLPAHGEARVIARAPAGLSGTVVAADAGTAIVTSSLLVGSADLEDDTDKRKNRKDRKVSAILHTGMPIRYWDSALGDESPRLFHLDPSADEPALVDLVPEAQFQLHEASTDITADGETVVSSWVERERAGQTRSGIIAIDVASGKARTLLDEPGIEYGYPEITADGTRLAVFRETPGTFDVADLDELLIHDMRDGGESRVIDTGDVTPTEYVWSPDGQTLFVAGDLHGRGAVLAVDGVTGAVRRRLVSDAVYSNLIPTPDGTQLYALRSLIDTPATPVRFAADRDDQEPEVLHACDGPGELPGTLTEVETDVDGVTVRGWLCLPPAGDGPAPLMVWIHGGPRSSWNSWSWRWNPWIAVQRGYAVLLPDPAMSTGYGQECIARGWPRSADVVWREVEALTDVTLARGGLDRDRMACMGGSFGGYMTNWIAGHTDRFRAIFTHAGLWAADQQHATTDAASYKGRLWGTPEDHPDWYAENSPHHFVANITTPMLVSHGDQDYRVPYSESLRLWWDLVSHFDGPPEEMPHRFLQFTGENHWILNASNSRVWYQTVLGFCDQHVRGREPLPAVLPDWRDDS